MTIIDTTVSLKVFFFLYFLIINTIHHELKIYLSKSLTPDMDLYHSLWLLGEESLPSWDQWGGTSWKCERLSSKSCWRDRGQHCCVIGMKANRTFEYSKMSLFYLFSQKFCRINTLLNEFSVVQVVLCLTLSNLNPSLPPNPMFVLVATMEIKYFICRSDSIILEVKTK